ncbi:MAG TPA: glycosyltransferase [Chloroflexota bacterium]|jgi:tetratricopeptide (TPR) repeat protein|nr:glycosyltransferase [Chloroflexota bacterium]
MNKSRSGQPARRQRPTITLCVIARNEEAFIGDCLVSARPYVDEMVVLDTGSTDGTADIARSLGARVETFTWVEDFAAARNAAAELATGAWILMLDADERLQPAGGEALRVFLESRTRDGKYYSVRIENQIADDDPTQLRLTYPNRLFQRDSGVRYVGAIHEDLVYLPAPSQSFGVRVDDIRVSHLGYRPSLVEARDKFERNRNLLLRETRDRPNDPLPWFYLGMDRLSTNQTAEAAEFFRQSVARKENRVGWSPVETYTQLINAYIQLQDTRLEAVVAEAERLGMLAPAGRGALAAEAVRRGLLDEAERHLLAAVGPDQPIVQVQMPGIGSWLTRLDLVNLYTATGNLAAALQQVDLVLADPHVPNPSAVATTAARLALQANDPHRLGRYLQSLPMPADSDLDGHLRLLEMRVAATPNQAALRTLPPTDRAIALDDWQAAYEAALALTGATMAEAARMIFVAARLHEKGAPDAALDILERLLDAQPFLPQLQFLLSRVLTDLGRFDDALAAHEILQQLAA